LAEGRDWERRSGGKREDRKQGKGGASEEKEGTDEMGIESSS